MSNVKRFLMVFLALVMILAATGLASQPAQAAGCSFYHTVSRGETLSWIGRYYGVNWVYLAQINGIRSPYTIYPWQQLCIAYGGATGGYPDPTPIYPKNVAWDYSIVAVDPGKTVTIKTSNFPSNVLFDVSIGRKAANGQYEWLATTNPIDSGKGGSFKHQVTIPAAYASESRLFVRVVQAKKGTTVDHWFNNTVASGSGGGGTGGLPNYGWWWGNIPTIWIAAVERNSRVLVYANNFPPGYDFNVYMGWMGTRGTNPGISSGTFFAGETQKWFDIPSQLYNEPQISIRTENRPSGYYSYNWFYNNTADVR